MHGRPDVTLVESAAYFLSRSESVLPHEKRLWKSYLYNNSIGFDGSRYM